MHMAEGGGARGGEGGCTCILCIPLGTPLVRDQNLRKLPQYAQNFSRFIQLFNCVVDPPDDPDPETQTNADPDPDPGQTLKSQKVEF
jgi:hypothetical protein